MHFKDNVFFFERGSDMLSDEMFYDRCWFVILNNGKPNVEALADVYIGRRYNDAKYPSHVTDVLQSMILP